MTDKNEVAIGEIDAYEVSFIADDQKNDVSDWHCVTTDDGIVAYMGDERLANIVMNLLRVRADSLGTLNGNQGVRKFVDDYMDGK